MGKHNALGKTMEEIMEQKKEEFIAGASGWKTSTDEIYEKWKSAEESLRNYRIAYEEEVEFRAQDNAQHRRELKMIASKAGNFRRRMCAGLFCLWLSSIAIGLLALTMSLTPIDKWLYISLCVAVMITSAWLWTVTYTHETFAETAARREYENDHDD